MKQQQQANNDKDIKEASLKIHNIIFALRCLHDVWSVFNWELQLLAKKHLNPKRASNISSVIKFYKIAEKNMEYALEFTKEIYKQDEVIRSCSEDAYEGLRHILPAALNMDFEGNDNFDQFLAVMPVSMYKRYKTWANRYFKDEKISMMLPPEMLKEDKDDNDKHKKL